RRVLAAVVFVQGFGLHACRFARLRTQFPWQPGEAVKIGWPSKCARSLLGNALPTTAGLSSLAMAAAVCEKRGKRWVEPAGGGPISELFDLPGTVLESGNAAK
ncbi:MAG TPA: hypothetical protein VIJ65_01125, partial [Acidobacteriaceae bacterium]